MAQGGSIPSERFVDANYEPKQRLSPIQGYELKPLVSLEESVRSIESLIQNIQGFVWTATGNCTDSKDGLTPNERAAIYMYTMECMYRQLNAALRNVKRLHLTPYFSYLKLLLTALWKLPNVKGVVWRGVKADLSEEYPKKNQFFWWGFSSCTTELDVLQSDEFLGETGTRTLFNIECYNGKLIRNHSQFAEECEVLLLPCSYFEVVGNIRQGSDLRIIHLRQTEPPYVMMQPPCSLVFTTDHQITQKSSNVQSTTQNLSQLSLASSSPSSTMTTVKHVLMSLNLNLLKMNPRLSIKSTSGDSCLMCANNKYLLYCYDGGLSLLDKKGDEKLKVQRSFTVHDICWSKYLNQFLILSDKLLYSLDITAGQTQQLKQIKEFNTTMWTCTCYEDTFLVSRQSMIEEYDLSNWNTKRSFKAPVICKETQTIKTIRFNSNGTHLGVILREGDHPNYRNSFELRNANDMNILKVVELNNGYCLYRLLSLPHQQFLVNSTFDSKLLLINSNGQLEEKLAYDAECLYSTALINESCLVIQKDQPYELRFYDV
jgi:hypothetical protein